MCPNYTQCEPSRYWEREAVGEVERQNEREGEKGRWTKREKEKGWVEGEVCVEVGEVY